MTERIGRHARPEATYPTISDQPLQPSMPHTAGEHRDRAWAGLLAVKNHPQSAESQALVALTHAVLALTAPAGEIQWATNPVQRLMEPGLIAAYQALPSPSGFVDAPPEEPDDEYEMFTPCIGCGHPKHGIRCDWQDIACSCGLIDPDLLDPAPAEPETTYPAWVADSLAASVYSDGQIDASLFYTIPEQITDEVLAAPDTYPPTWTAWSGDLDRNVEVRACRWRGCDDWTSHGRHGHRFVPFPECPRDYRCKAAGHVHE